jgi:ribonuclease-3
MVARMGLNPPEYSVESIGPDHDKTFTASVRVGKLETFGVGRSKKAAEQVAAQAACDLLDA